MRIIPEGSKKDIAPSTAGTTSAGTMFFQLMRRDVADFHERCIDVFQSMAAIAQKLSRPALVAAVVLAVIGVVMTGWVLWMVQPVSDAARRGPRVRANGLRLRDDVYALAKPRDVSNTKALDETAAYIAARLRKLGYQPVDQPYVVDGRTYRNVSVVVGDAAAARVVVGAHYDSCEAKPAADDNASGVAVVLELARLFKEHPAPGTLELVFWTLEEPPIFRTANMGSVVHATSLERSGVKVRAALSIETVGYYRSEPGTQHFPVPFMSALYSDRGNYIALVSNLGNAGLVRDLKRAMRATRTIAVHSFNAPEWIPGIDWSDHASYWQHGFPAVMVTDSAPNRNPNYHRDTDTPDTLSYPHMARLTEALFEGVWALSDRAS